MTRIGIAIRHYLLTPFGLAALGCLILAGWALWSGGIFDGAVATQVRTSSVYAAPGTGLNTAAAEKIIGNRRLVVILMKPGADLSAGCDEVKHAAKGTLVLLLSRDGTSYDSYGCTLFAGSDKKNFGNAFVAEQLIGNGIDQFAGDPLDAVKVIAINFDQLVRAGILPGEARTISPSFPRYLVAIAAIVAVLAGSGLLYAAARRAGRLTAARQARRDRAQDSRTVLSAATAAVAQQIIDLDGRFTAGALPTQRTAKKRRTAASPANDYRSIASDYTHLLDDVATADRAGETDFDRYVGRAEALAGKLRALAD
jgi:hypothetical protein